MTLRVNIAQKYDVEFREADGITVDEFLRHMDELADIDRRVVEWHNETIYELSRDAVQRTLAEENINAEVRSFLTSLLQQSGCTQDIIRVEFY